MHVGEEVFKSVRMSLVEYERVAAEISEMVTEHEIDVPNEYPILHRFFGALGYCAGDGETPIVEDEPILDVSTVEEG